MDGNKTQGVCRLEAALRAAHAGRDIPDPDPQLLLSVMATIKTEAASEEPAANSVLWRMAVGAGVLAVAMVVLTLVLGNSFQDELGRFLFYDPNGQVLVSLLGV